MGDAGATYLIPFTALLAAALLFYDAGRRFAATVSGLIVMLGLYLGALLAVDNLAGRDVTDARSSLPRVRSLVATDVTLRRAFDGHFYSEVEVNGAPVRFVVDTGATVVILSREDARRIGLDPDALDYTGRARTANGEVRMAPVTLDEMTLAGVTMRNVRAAVNGGALDTSLLGMSFLRLFEGVEMRDNRMVFRAR
ncbi:TIGR02281 family clan AA aspartic protease [Rhodobacteraceae bacterium 2CG4]|uniref:TIGR02281 family clan AA aspartic protease n=1 Tax=Halovulum marinum TaxID=2662447 RepID=A0A6L5Z006_9RHOB|nr:TIGR02281 family clan AA aspartic protease [Halovulum marinum]MSU89873.1 TIGR02281 family clan AA aspartic protease [Halovulum marinum]